MIDADQQAALLHVDRFRTHPFNPFVVEVREPYIDGEVLEVAQDLDRALRQDGELDTGMTRLRCTAFVMSAAIGSAEGMTPTDR